MQDRLLVTTYLKKITPGLRWVEVREHDDLRPDRQRTEQTVGHPMYVVKGQYVENGVLKARMDYSG